MSAFQQAAANIRRWKAEPQQFVRDVFGASPDPWQAKTLEACKTQPRIALKACKGPGKSCLMAWVGWWFLLTHLHAKAIAVSITRDNLRDNLWTELATWRNKAPLLKHAFEWTAERIFAKDHPETWWMSARSFAKDADPQAQANTLAGLHGDNCLVLLDEFSDMPDGVVAASEGAQSVEGQKVLILAAGNPTRTEGPLYRICTKDRATWWVLEITGDPDDPDRSPRISKEWARQQIATWGRDSSFVRTNVLGQFPKTQSDKLLGPDDVSEACKRNPRSYDAFPRVLGVDVARFGADATVLFPRQGPVAMAAEEHRELDTVQVADRVSYAITTWQPTKVFVDSTGIGGGVVDQLHQRLFKNVEGIEFGSRATEPNRFVNRRAEMWWRLADWIKSGGAIPDDPALRAQLVAPSYWFEANGRFALESKDDLKARGLESPDHADALALTFAAYVAAPIADPVTGLWQRAQASGRYTTGDADLDGRT